MKSYCSTAAILLGSSWALSTTSLAHAAPTYTQMKVTIDGDVTLRDCDCKFLSTDVTSELRSFTESCTVSVSEPVSGFSVSAAELCNGDVAAHRPAAA